jgi:hypothetical protein
VIVHSFRGNLFQPRKPAWVGGAGTIVAMGRCVFGLRMSREMEYGPGDLDVLARAFYGALNDLPPQSRDPEQIKAILMTGILDAARGGERDEMRLRRCALAAVRLFDQDENSDQDETCVPPKPSPKA